MHCINYEDAENELKKHGFTVHEVIGEGCFGVVHKAVDKEGNVRAVKTVKAPTREARRKKPRGTQRRLVEIVKDEISVANALAARLRQDPADYDGVVKVYGTIVTARYYHVVMECLAGTDLKTFMDERYPSGMPLPLVQRLAWSVLRGLRVMHGLGALHRDLKPDNVFVEYDSAGNVVAFKLIDVGLGRVVVPPEDNEKSENANVNENNDNNEIRSLDGEDGGGVRSMKKEDKTTLDMKERIGDDDDKKVGKMGKMDKMSKMKMLPVVAQSCVGSPLYRSPVVELGYKYGPECDIWGAGYILYYGATGKCLTSMDEKALKREKLYVWENCDRYGFAFPSVYSDDVKALLRATMSKVPLSLEKLLDDIWFEAFRIQSDF